MLPLYKIAKPSFGGIKYWLQAHDQRSGVRTNTKAQVLERTDQLSGQFMRIDQEKVIQHPYAAGEIVVGYVGAVHRLGKMEDCMIWIRIADQNAAKETPPT
jgi:hypothetical protein